MVPGRELPAIQTPVSENDFYAAIHAECPELSPAGLCVLMSHWALETGRGKKCMSYNIGNIKALDTDKADFCYFKTFERLTEAEAEKIAAESTVDAPVHLLSKFSSGFALVQFDPRHPWARFLAYETLPEGVKDYIKHLRVEFALAWPDVIQGCVVGFCGHLKELGYFTASESAYIKAMQALYGEYVKRFT